MRPHPTLRKYAIGIETLKDIIKELQSPGHDPRDELDPPKICFQCHGYQHLERLRYARWCREKYYTFLTKYIGLHNHGTCA